MGLTYNQMFYRYFFSARFLFYSSLLLTICLVGSFACPASVQAQQKHPELQVSSRLRPRVNFWIDIFGRYTKAQVVIHHRRFPQIRFALLDVADATAGASAVQFDSYKDRALKAKLKEVREDIDWLASGQATRTQQQKRIEQAMDILGPGLDKYKRIQEDPDLVRGQSGIREKMEEAIIRSGRYLPIMEDIFVNEFNLPVELTRLPFVESSFDYKAYSTVAAAGIWQFMPKTAKTYMRVNSLVDERLDPIESTRAAAKYLKSAYARLGTWPLALTSYNHGVAGVLSKVRKFGTADIATLVENGSSQPPFGFASANFFPSYLAAKEVFDRRHEFFPKLRMEKPLDLVVVKLSKPYRIVDIKKALSVTEEQLRAANYAISSQIWAGRASLPAGYNLKVPAEFEAKIVRARLGSSEIQQSSGFEDFTKDAKELAIKTAQKEAIQKVEKASAPVKQAKSYTVKAGDTLYSIARVHNVSVEDLQKENQLKNSFVFVGKSIKIPAASATPKPKGGAVTLYTVKKGDTLSSVSKKFSIPVSELLKINGMTPKKSAIKVGQTIKLPR